MQVQASVMTHRCGRGTFRAAEGYQERGHAVLAGAGNGGLHAMRKKGVEKAAMAWADWSDRRLMEAVDSPGRR